MEQTHTTHTITTILALPNEVLETVGDHLDGLDLASLSFVCRRLHSVLNKDIIWQEVIRTEKIHVAGQVKDFAETVMTEIKIERERVTDTDNLGTLGTLGPLSLSLTSPYKLEYIVARRVKSNWAEGHYKEGMIHHFSEEVRIGASQDYLVALESGRLRAWNIRGKWIDLLTTKPVNISLENPNQNVYQILVSGSIALLCFTFSEQVAGSDYQHIQAYDLLDGCQLLWEKSGLLGRQYHVIRLLGSHLYILDLLMERVEVYHIGRTQPTPTKVLVQQPNTVRIPHGDMSASDKFLAVPGKKVPENSPVICCWNIQTGERRILSPDRPVCPFRWFQKSAVKDDMIYGLLNRFRLIGWDGGDGQVIFSLDLTNSSPGDNEETYSWLEVGPDILLTVHQDKFVVSILSSCGRVLGKVCPADHLNWIIHDPESVSMVEEVCLTGMTAVIRILNYSIQKNSISCIILSSDISPVLGRLNRQEEGQLDEMILMAHVVAQHIEPLDSPHCQLLVNDTKVFDVQPLGIKFYDYLIPEDRLSVGELSGCDSQGLVL
eukprot:GFUD01070459.1.p1 GENE.GFUD01070459.1~~GFUD01070459.1.p1  ORF type:complete len:547 (+),score=144.18 GFUD01070459.1:118-1758(+)